MEGDMSQRIRVALKTGKGKKMDSALSFQKELADTLLSTH